MFKLNPLAQKFHKTILQVLRENFQKGDLSYVGNYYCCFGGFMVVRFNNEHGGESYSFAFSSRPSGFDCPFGNRQKSCLAY